MSKEGAVSRRVFEAGKRLAAILRDLAERERSYLDKLKLKHRREFQRDDFVWIALLRSASTMGNSQAYRRLFENPQMLRKVRFETLKALSRPQRQKVLSETPRATGMRWPDRKAKWLNRNFQRIVKLGGPKEAKRALLSAPGREGKIKFLRTFDGIGPKYARNIMMDIYHRDFHESIAVDARIKAISRRLGLFFKGYAEHEQFYLDCAHDAGLNGWELDRLIYNFKEEIESRLSRSESSSGPEA